MQGVLDEPAHLLTAWLVLRALRPRLGDWPVARWALAGAVLIDVDHLPLYLTGGEFAVDGGRPPTHSLVLALLLTLGGVRRTWRGAALGLALGVVLHVARDLATGPGVPLLWPVGAGNWSVPYPAYLAAVCSLSLLAVLRARTTAGESTLPVTGPGARATRTTPT